MDSDDDDRPFVKRLKELEKRGVVDAKRARSSRTPPKTNGCRVKKGDFEWLMREKANDDEALARDAATKERRAADDANLERDDARRGRGEERGEERGRGGVERIG